MNKIKFGTIENKTEKGIVLFQLVALSEFPGKEIAHVQPNKTSVLDTYIDVHPIKGHNGESASFLFKSVDGSELLVNILWAEQESGVGFFIDMSAQNRITNECYNLEGFRRDNISVAEVQRVIIDLTIEGSNFEETTVNALLETV